MAEFKFACPHCGQNIQCDDQWSGQQIACPSCSGNLSVPQLAPVASFASPPPIQRAATPAPAVARAAQSAPRNDKKILPWSVGVAAFAVALYFGIKMADKWQTSFNKKADEMAAKSDGGEFGHAANLYKVLDATDPDKIGAAQARSRASVETSRASLLEALKPKPDPTLAMPLLPATWTLDGASFNIPKGRVNGMSSGTNFHVETVRLDRNPSTAVLAFQEGVGTSDDHELLIYLPASATENLGGRSWTVTTETKGKDALQIVRKWTLNPRFAPVSKTFNNGYALKLELDEPTRDWQPGRIFLALPDTNQTVLAGEFSIPVPRKQTMGRLGE